MSIPLNLLLVEDSEADALLIIRELKHGGYKPTTFKRVDTPEGFRAALVERDWDVIISDYSLPRFSGSNALKLLQESEIDLPFIIVSGTIGEEIAVGAMKAGAHDYVMKDNLARLVPAVRRELREAKSRQARKQAEAKLHTRERFLACLSEIAQHLLQSDDLTETLPDVLRRLGETASVSRAYLVERCRRVKGRLRCNQQYEWHASGIEQQPPQIHPQGSPYVQFTRWMEILERGDIIAGSLSDFPASEQSLLKSRNIRSILVIPLFIANAWYGFIGFDVCDRAREWQQVEIDLLQIAASDIASAIEREQTRDREKALSKAIAALTSTLDFDQVLDRILEELSYVIPNDAANVMLIEGKRANVVRSRGYEGFDTERFISNFTFRIPELANLQYMVENKRPVVIPDITAANDWIQVPTQDWLRSYAGAPIIVRDEVIGFLNVDSATPNFFTPDHIVPLRTFADHTAAAIENARLFEEVQHELTRRKQAEKALQRRNRELTLINRAGQAFISSLDLTQVLVTILDEVRCLMDVTACSIWLLDPETGNLVCREATGEASELVQGWHLAPARKGPGGEGLVWWAVKNSQALMVPDAQVDERHFKGVDQYTGLKLRSILTVPLKVRENAIGALQVADVEVDRFEPTDLTLIESLASTAAFAIENARLFSTEQQRAAALARALEQQKELDRLKDEFIQNVSHELRTPLALIQGYAELLRSGDLGELKPEQVEPIAVIVRRAYMLGDMVKDLTALLQTEREDAKRKVVDMSCLAQDMLSDFRVAVKEKDLTLIVQVPPDLPPVRGVPTHLRRMLDNLLGNALKFTPAGGCITVRLEQQGSDLVLQVSDTGIGIPDDKLEHIFERFYQVDGSVTRRYGGTGLGLAMVKEIVEAHDGSIDVESTLGEGSTFEVTLPVTDPNV
jgi:signal transduction histidine kinase/FixJ family two-component response regulator